MAVTLTDGSAPITSFFDGKRVQSIGTLGGTFAFANALNDRGQITGGLVDGPLAFDNAVSVEAAQTKHIVSSVAGRADILVVPNLEAGNMVAKQLQYLAGADSAGIVLGARVPIILTSRADSVRTRLASAAVLKLLARAQQLKAQQALQAAQADGAKA